jgi:hypothetical protein
MTGLPDKLSKTYWAKKHDEELEMLSDLTGKTADEIERDLSEPDANIGDCPHCGGFLNPTWHGEGDARLVCDDCGMEVA